jgi:hypothetical protein
VEISAGNLHRVLSSILIIGAAFLAAVFVALEQWDRRKPLESQSWRLWLALLFVIVTLVAGIVESVSTRQAERERAADLKLVQKLNMSLKSLCFEFRLRDPDERYKEGTLVQLQTYLPVADLSTTGQFAEYIHINYSPDSGWYRGRTDMLAWPSIVLHHDSPHERLRFEMSPFGVRWKNQLAWKAERLADVSQVRIGLQVHYSSTSAEEPTDSLWLPIGSVAIYANSFEAANLITVLTPHIRAHQPFWNPVYFHPENQPVVDPDWFNFNIDLIRMRENILSNL